MGAASGSIAGIYFRRAFEWPSIPTLFAMETEADRSTWNKKEFNDCTVYVQVGDAKRDDDDAAAAVAMDDADGPLDSVDGNNLCTTYFLSRNKLATSSNMFYSMLDRRFFEAANPQDIVMPVANSREHEGLHYLLMLIHNEDAWKSLALSSKQLPPNEIAAHMVIFANRLDCPASVVASVVEWGISLRLDASEACLVAELPVPEGRYPELDTWRDACTESAWRLMGALDVLTEEDVERACELGPRAFGQLLVHAPRRCEGAAWQLLCAWAERHGGRSKEEKDNAATLFELGAHIRWWEFARGFLIDVVLPHAQRARLVSAETTQKMVAFAMASGARQQIMRVQWKLPARGGGAEAAAEEAKEVICVVPAPSPLARVVRIIQNVCVDGYWLELNWCFERATIAAPTTPCELRICALWARSQGGAPLGKRKRDADKADVTEPMVGVFCKVRQAGVLAAVSESRGTLSRHTNSDGDGGGGGGGVRFARKMRAGRLHVCATQEPLRCRLQMGDA
jgi:hypothetical protein